MNRDFSAKQNPFYNKLWNGGSVRLFKKTHKKNSVFHIQVRNNCLVITQGDFENKLFKQEHRFANKKIATINAVKQLNLVRQFRNFKFKSEIPTYFDRLPFDLYQHIWK